MRNFILPVILVLILGVAGGLMIINKNSPSPSTANPANQVNPKSIKIPSNPTSDSNGLQLKTFSPDTGKTSGSGSSQSGGSSGNCTFTIGYWKNHAGFGPQTDAVTPLLPIWLGTPNGKKSVNVTTAAQAVEFLNKEFDASNGVSKLYAQGLGTKLNIKSGSTQWPTVLDPEVDPFLAKYNSADWATMSDNFKQKALLWASMFDEYNNGISGPGHCPS